MKTLLVGYGSMGREIEKILISRGHSVAAIVDPLSGTKHREVTVDLLDQADVAIDFSSPSGVEKNCGVYVRGKTPVVMGTTGWDSLRDKIKSDVEKAGIGFIWGANYSIGAHIFFHLLQKASRLANAVPEYDLMLHELHHRRKKDSPSGTAITAAGIVVAASDRKDTIVTEKLDRQIKDNEIHVSSTRGGEIPGTHTLYLDSPADTIEITHRARNRNGFALGAVMAAEWIPGKIGFINVDDFISELLK